MYHYITDNEERLEFRITLSLYSTIGCSRSCTFTRPVPRSAQATYLSSLRILDKVCDEQEPEYRHDAVVVVPWLYATVHCYTPTGMIVYQWRWRVRQGYRYFDEPATAVIRVSIPSLSPTTVAQSSPYECNLVGMINDHAGASGAPSNKPSLAIADTSSFEDSVCEGRSTRELYEV